MTRDINTIKAEIINQAKILSATAFISMSYVSYMKQMDKLVAELAAAEKELEESSRLHGTNPVADAYFAYKPDVPRDGFHTACDEDELSYKQKASLHWMAMMLSGVQDTINTVNVAVCKLEYWQPTKVSSSQCDELRACEYDIDAVVERLNKLLTS